MTGGRREWQAQATEQGTDRGERANGQAPHNVAAHLMRRGLRTRLRAKDGGDDSLTDGFPLNTAGMTGGRREWQAQATEQGTDRGERANGQAPHNVAAHLMRRGLRTRLRAKDGGDDSLTDGFPLNTAGMTGELRK